MDIDDYQTAAKATAVYPEQYTVIYPALGLCGESGEVAEKVKKILRDNGGEISAERRLELSKEIGDCMWYVAALATDLGLSCSDILSENLEKLNSRKLRGKIGGSGDDR